MSIKSGVKNKGHYFTLQPRASVIVDRIPAKSRRKSGMVSDAIVWFNSPRDFIVDEYGKRRELVLADLVASRDALQELVYLQAAEIKELKKQRGIWFKLFNK